ncbi:MAG TPA: ABC transporter substrate-binding protein [Acidimicrobiales bacterium]|nr:ABC transporter substrate-binding protein [Acidimicrobiales bacterium]
MRRGSRRTRRRALVTLTVLALLTTACGSRLTGGALSLAEGAGHGGTANGTDTGLNSNGTSGTSGTSGTAGTSGTGGTSGTSGGSGSLAGATAAGGGTSASCNASNNGGATDQGVTANSITVGNITSISGVAPGLTQSAQQATQAWAAYVNSQGGICGRMIHVQTFDDGNDSGQNYADATQACASDFAMVGNASGFDDGSANALSSGSCVGMPDVAAEISTHAAGNVPTIWGASPGNAHYWATGPAVWLKSQYPSAVTNAAMIYLQVPATQEQAQSEINAYQSVGWKYTYQQAATPTDTGYCTYVNNMASAKVQYVTEYSDVNSAERLSEALANPTCTGSWKPQVVDWFAEEYTPDFISQTNGSAVGNLLLMATAPYEDAASNPGLQLMMSWVNRIAPNFKHDIFAELAWSAGMAFLQAAKAVGPHLTRAALDQQLMQIHQWTGGGMTPPITDFANKIPTPCFAYMKITATGFQRIYPTQPDTYDCTSGSLVHY